MKRYYKPLKRDRRYCLQEQIGLLGRYGMKRSKRRMKEAREKWILRLVKKTNARRGMSN